MENKWRKAIVCFLFIATLTGCESLFFWPTKELVNSPKEFNFDYETLYFNTEDGVKLHSWLVPAAKTDKLGTIMFLHGNAQNLSYHIANLYWLTYVGWDVFIFDYRGYGVSEGEPSFASVQQDAMSAYQTIRKRSVNGESIILWGQSLGAAIASNLVAELSEHERPRGLIIDSGFSSHREIMRQVMGKSWLLWAVQYPLSMTVTDDYAPYRALSQVENVPVLIVHSKQDPLIGPSHAERLYESSMSDKALWLTQTQGHIKIWNDDDWRAKVICQLRRWPDLQPAEKACDTL
jgi:fermentation-respiration switch protein FrsA (DUF1100 family)